VVGLSAGGVVTRGGSGQAAIGKLYLRAKLFSNGESR